MNRRGGPHFLAYLVAIGLTLFIGFPLFWMVLSSLKPSSELFVYPPRVLPREITLVWYHNVIANSDTITLFRNSLIIGLSTTFICLTIGSLAAYGVTRFDFPGRRIFVAGALVSYLFPAVVLFIAVYMIIN